VKRKRKRGGEIDRTLIFPFAHVILIDTGDIPSVLRREASRAISFLTERFHILSSTTLIISHSFIACPPDRL
jgi:hypothetical protein